MDKIGNNNIGNNRFTDTGLVGGTYWYRVRATSWVGDRRIVRL